MTRSRTRFSRAGSQSGSAVDLATLLTFVFLSRVMTAISSSNKDENSKIFLRSVRRRLLRITLRRRSRAMFNGGEVVTSVGNKVGGLTQYLCTSRRVMDKQKGRILLIE